MAMSAYYLKGVQSKNVELNANIRWHNAFPWNCNICNDFNVLVSRHSTVVAGHTFC